MWCHNQSYDKRCWKTRRDFGDNKVWVSNLSSLKQSAKTKDRLCNQVKVKVKVNVKVNIKVKVQIKGKKRSKIMFS